MKWFGIFNSPAQGASGKENDASLARESENKTTRTPFIVFGNDPSLNIKKVGEKDRGELSGEVIRTETPNSGKPNF